MARQQGTSLDALIRSYIEQLAGQTSGEQLCAEFEALWATPGRSSGNHTFDRNELYSERSDGYKQR